MNNQKMELEGFNIDENVKQVLLGSLFGDGSLAKGTKNAGYIEGHSLEQDDYFFWKVNILSKCFRVKVRFGNNGPKHFAYKLSTNYSPVLTQLHNLYYVKATIPNRKWIKVVNHIALEQLKPLSLAIWYCDDGTYCVRDGSCTLSTQGFTYEENLLLKRYFLTKWGINTVVIKDVKKYKEEYRTYYKLVFNKKEAEKLLSLIKDFVPDCMIYKLGRISDKNKGLMESEDKRYKAIRKIEYYDNHDKVLAKAERYRVKNRQLINKKRVSYYWENIEKSRISGRDTMRKRRLLNSERVNLINHDYYHRNKDRINKTRLDRLLNDPEYRKWRNKKQREWYHKRKLELVNKNGVIS